MNFLSFYIALNLTVMVSSITLALGSRWTKPYARELRLHYAALVVSFLAPLLVFNKGIEPRFSPIVKVWSGRAPYHKPTHTAPRGLMEIHKAQIPVPADLAALFVTGLVLGAGLVGTVMMAKGYGRLRKILRGAYLLRAIGRVRILASADIQIPFSYFSGARAYVLVPEYLLPNSSGLRLAIAHELQHHRQRDTLWAYVNGLAKAVCVFNPFAHFWHSWIGEIQEFACDEALAGRPGFRKQAYARCLVEVAETAWVHGTVPHGAAGLSLLSRGNLLNRRIQVMFREKQSPGRLAGLAGFAVITVMVAGTAYAAKGLVQDRRVTLAQAKELAAKAAPKDSVFPIVVNEEVLRYLNQYIGTPEGRERMRASLRRLQSYRVMVEAKIAEYNVPPELMAIPITESGYQNLEDRNVEGWGAGLWMFITSTAKNYGLVVDQVRDDRLNERLETDAAMRYLVSNHARFQDWLLAVMAYNAGEEAVQRAIFRTGSRDAWTLIRQGGFSAEVQSYLPKVMAAIVIMRNPSSVE